MTWKVMVCWLVIHTAADKTDNRRIEQFKGTIVDSGPNQFKINFSEDLAKHNIDPQFNDFVQWISDNECSYVE